jgi:protein-tyrosine phosphatase
MIDIHNHILHGLDDGAQDFETSVKMARAAIENGITHVVCTPHCNDHHPFDPGVNRERVAALQDAVGSELILGLGCDFHLSFDNIEDHFRNPGKYTINNKQYLLVEFQESFIPHQLTDVLYRMIAGGVVPIITHPERNDTLSAHPERMTDWLDAGCLIQLTAASIVGRWGKPIEAVSRRFLADNWVHIVASDAHNLSSRTFLMREAHARLVELLDEETADRLCIRNPRAVFYGDPMPDQPEIKGAAGSAQQKGILKRFLSRG